MAYPPQGPGFNGYQGFQPPPKPNRTALIISLVVAAVVLIGGGVGAFFLLNKKDDSKVADKPAVVVSTTGTSSATGTTSNSIQSPAPATSTHTSTSHDATSSSSPTSSDDPTSTGAGDLATAENLVATWLSFINEGDYETAAFLICEAQQQDCIDGFQPGAPVNQLEQVDLEQDGENMMLIVGAVGDETGASYLQLTMRPTNTGYFLICDGPLSETDLNW